MTERGIEIETLSALFRRHFGREPESTTRLAGDGSARRIYRLSDGAGTSVVGVLGPDLEENRAFLTYSRAFATLRLPVPEIHEVDEARGAWIEQDLGDVTLFRALTEARGASDAPFPTAFLPHYRRVVEYLCRFQVEGGKALDFSVAYPRSDFDLRSIQWDLSYFKYHFLKLGHVPFHEDRLQDDFDRFTAWLLEDDARHFLYRDFQSRNVMLVEGRPWFLDYQGGRRGPLAYDLASLLYDAKARLSEEVRRDLRAHYLGALSEHIPVDRERFERRFPAFVLLRILQALGAYGYRGFYERKPGFVESIVPAVENLRGLLAQRWIGLETPALQATIERLVGDDRFARPSARATDGLEVRVGSFSYRSGIPTSGGAHGGGYVFDCRALPNPAREPALAGLTGLDDPVISRLQGDAAVETYYEHVRGLVDAQVQRYLARSFDSLEVRFGCTGGRHRSVYLAERLAADLEARHPDLHIVRDHAESARWSGGKP